MKSRSPWFILIIILLASMAAPLNQFKVPPVMPLLIGGYLAYPLPAGLHVALCRHWPASGHPLAGLDLSEAVSADWVIEPISPGHRRRLGRSAAGI
jgi:hypothetical protein